MKKLFLIGLITLSNLAIADGPDPRKVYIKKITWAGSGCPEATSIGSSIGQDATSFTLSFSEFSAEIGPGVPGGDNYSKCKIKVDLRFPQGWSYTLFDADYRGEVYLEKGTSADFTSKYFFQSNPDDYVTFNTHIDGEYDDYFQRRDSIGLDSVVWSPCGKNRALNIEAEVNLEATNSQAAGAFWVDSLDGVFTHIYGIRWERCY